MRRITDVPGVAPTAKFFCHAVRTGNTIYVSGQVSLDREGNVVGKGDMAAQTRQAIANIEAILATEGSTLNDVVKITMYVTDMSLAPHAREVRMEYFSKHPPASTGLEVKGLAHPDLLVELECIAVLEAP
jgi:reactive intermediate/imine deaminase